MKRYGVPYMGSKNKIAEKIVDMLPKADNFYDLFAGGCAITDCAMQKGKYKNYYINDVLPYGVNLFTDALQGKFKDEKRWISRDDFYKLKDIDAYVRISWSFGNNQRDYLYSREIEPYKKAVHYAVVLNDFSYADSLNIDLHEIGKSKDIRQRVLMAKHIIKDLQKKDFNLQNQSLESLERLQSLESLESLESLQKTIGDYRDVEIKPNSVVYCDIPYHNTRGYKESKHTDVFDYDAFYNWCRNISKRDDIKLFISSYEMPCYFKTFASMKHRSTLSATANNEVEEKLFTLQNIKQYTLQNELFA